MKKSKQPAKPPGSSKGCIYGDWAAIERESFPGIGQLLEPAQNVGGRRAGPYH
jgi:hypothetical protein